MSGRVRAHWESHQREALLEDARFLLDSGLEIGMVARRLGVNVKTLEKMLQDEKVK